MDQKSTSTLKSACAEDSMAAPSEDNKPVILFVDDEQSILVALKRLSRKMPWQVLTANTGQEALRIVDEHVVSVVVSDMRMPEMDGAAVLAAINERSPDTRQILMTGYSDMESTVKAINNANVYSYVTKPWDNENLKMIIERALYERRLEEERNSLSDALQEKNADLEEQVAKRTSQLEKALKVIKRSMKQTKDSQVGIVKLLSNMIEQRDVAVTPGRAARVAKASRHLAEKLEYENEEVEAIYFAGLLSDIGKIALPDSLLRTPFSELTPQNKELYKQHPILAEATLMSIEALKPTAMYLRQQCEKYVGGGYPDNLAGDQIAVGAQLIAMVSYFDVQHYGNASDQGQGQEEALKKLKASAGKLFSSELVKLFVDQLEGGLFDDIQADERSLVVEDLHEGMKLSRDLVADNGVLLFSEGKVLDAHHIECIKEYLCRSHSSLMIFVTEEAKSLEETNG